MIKQLANLLDNDNETKVVQTIVLSLGTTYRDFTHASEIYNSVFFRNESASFKVALCTALSNHFEGMTNLFWEKAANVSEPSPSV